MSAGMATKVQTKTHFIGSVMDLNNTPYNGLWDPYRDYRNSGYNSFLMSQTVNGNHGYPKEQMRLTILKQESIFRHQLRELHRVYKRQKDLMNELAIPKDVHTQRRVIDLELPADVDDDNERNEAVKVVHNLRTKRACNLVDLNDPIHMEEASFSACVTSDYFVTDKLQKQDLSRNRMIFGVELSESSHKPSFDSSQSSSWDQNTSSVNHSRWIEPCEKHYGKKNHKNLENQLPHWLLKTKGKETTLYQMNLDSLQQNSQQFFKKAENLQTDGITKILGVTIVNKHAENDTKKHILETTRDFDLNLFFNEEEEDNTPSTPSIPEATVKTASMEIDLETPAAVDDEPDDDQELVKSAAEAIIVISSSEVPPDDTLLWLLAEVVASGDDLKESVNVDNEDCIPEGMDYFEYMTLKLPETKEEYHIYEAVNVVETEEDGGLLTKRATRKGQGKRGRVRKDFQRDVLPGIVSLSRREVSEDLQIFEEAFKGIGVSWRSKRKPGGKNGRGRWRLVGPSPPSPPPPPPPPPPKSVCWEVAGWGKRTRRLPRQRCQNGGNHHSLALKC